MSEENQSPQPESTDAESRAANRSANIGCLLLVLVFGILFFSFALGGYSTYRLYQYRAELIHQHLGTAIIPELQFQNLPPDEAMKLLRELVIEQDPWFKSVQFKFYSSRDLKDAVEYDNPKPIPLLTLTLKDTSAAETLNFMKELTDGTLEIIDGSVNLLPKNETLEPRKALSFKGVSPDYWQSHPLIKAEVPAEFWNIQPALEADGLPFPPRSFARYYPGQRRLEISNLKANNEKIILWLQEKKLLP